MLFTGKESTKLDLPVGIDESTLKLLARYELIVFLLKFCLSLIAIVFGIVFICKGISSDSTVYSGPN